MKTRRASLPFREGALTDSVVSASVIDGLTSTRIGGILPPEIVHGDIASPYDYFAATAFSTGTGLIDRISFASATL